MRQFQLILVIVFIGFTPYSKLCSQELDTLVEIQEVTIPGYSPPVIIRPWLQGNILKGNSRDFSASTSLAQILSSKSSAFIKSYGQGGLSSISLLGTNSSHTQINWNDVPLNSPMNGAMDLNLIPIAVADEVYLYYGNESISQTSGGLGGLLNLNTKIKTTRPHELKGELSAGSFGTYSGYIDSRNNFNNLSAGIRVYGLKSENDFTYLNTANGLFNETRQMNSAYNNYGGLLSMSYAFKPETYIALNYWNHQSERNLPPIMTFEGSDREERQLDNAHTVSLKLFHKKNTVHQSFSAYYRYTGLDYFLGTNTQLGQLVNYSSLSQTHISGASYQLEWNKEKLTLEGDISMKKIWNDIFNEKSNKSLFYEREEIEIAPVASYILSDRWSIAGSARLSIYDGKTTPFMYQAKTRYLLDSTGRHILDFSFGRVSHIPTLNDLYWIPGGNENLRPESGHNAILSYLHTSQLSQKINIHGKINLFASVIEDWIMWRPSEFSYWTAKNIDAVFARGIELFSKIDYKTKDWNFETTGRYVYTRTSNQTGRNKFDFGAPQLIYIPIHKINLSQEIQYQNISFRYHINAVSQRFTTDSNQDRRHRLDGYGIHEAHISYTHPLKKERNVSLSVSCYNLLNTDYQSILWRPMPGRNFSASLKFDL